jgi:protein-disulfide isomerase/N-acetylneuraminic acid mutarotase
MATKMMLILIVATMAIIITSGTTTVAPLFATLSLSSYTQGPDMPTPRSEAPAASIEDKIYVVGGSPGAMDVVEAYDTNNETWTSSEMNGSSVLAPLPIGINHAAAASFDGNLYVVGGYLTGQVEVDHLFIYDPIANEWSEGAPMSTPRAALTANFINGTLYVAGGANIDSSALDTLEAYHPVNNTWTQLDPMPTGRQHLTSTVVDGKLYVIGGRISGSTNFNSTEVFDPLSDNWTVVEDMPSKRGGLAAAAIGDSIYVFGGELFGGESPDMVFDNNEKYNTTSNSWTSGVDNIPTARHGLTAVAVDDNIYLIGGGLEPGTSHPATSIVEVYHPDISVAGSSEDNDDILTDVESDNISTSDNPLSLGSLSNTNGGSPVLGSLDAPVTVVDFSDFQCPNCARHVRTTEPEIKSEYIDTGNVAYVFKHFPWRGTDSLSAALASECANEQDKFWEYHDVLFENQEGSGWASIEKLKEFASEMGLDAEQFDSCLDSEKYKSNIDRDLDLVEELDLNTTPSFLILNSDGTEMEVLGGAHPFPSFQAFIDERLS